MIPQDTLIPVITTARLVLRGPCASDAAPLAAFLTSPRAKWIGGPFPDDDAAEWLDWQRGQWARFALGSWIVALRKDDTPIGRLGVLEHEGWPEPELGWFLFDGHEGQGYAYEAALCARAYVAEALKLPPLFSFIEAANLRSRKLVERLGATHESNVRFDGHDFQVYRHTAPEACR
jgi:RimJ/RimL family protein N-acetyltransferase